MNPHPRLFSDADFPAKVAAAPNLWRNTIKTAELATLDSDRERIICAAGIYRFGLLPGYTYKFTTAEQYGQQAIADALAATVPTREALDAVTHAGFDLALCYDWCWPLLTNEQKATLAAKIEVELALKKKPYPVGISASPWTAVNSMSAGGLSMSLAISGEVATDWVSDYSQNSVWEDNFPNWNLQWVKRFLQGGGDPEGYSYFAREAPPWIDKYCWESATGDLTTFAGMRFFDDAPLWQAWAYRPDFTPGKDNWVLPQGMYSALATTHAGSRALRCAMTGNPDPNKAAVSRWLVDQQRGYGVGIGAASGLLLGLLIGDPRVVPKSPAELNLPLTYDMPGWGPHFWRSSWQPDATIVFAGCGTTAHRAEVQGDVTLFSKGHTVTGYRGAIVSHHYGPDFLKNRIQFYDAANPTRMIVQSLHNDGTPEWMERASCIRVGNTIRMDLSKLYVDATTQKFTPRVMFCTRDVAYDGDRIVTISDNIVCDQALAPHQIWNTPDEPTVIDAYTVETSAGRWRFDQPVTIYKSGGWLGADGLQLLCRELDGSDPRVMSNDPVQAASQYKAAYSEFLSLPEENRTKAGGYWRFHAVPTPANPGKIGLVTRIEAL